MTESEISQRICDRMKKEHKALIFKFHGHAMQVPGLPDFFLATEYFNCWVETKGATTVLRSLQQTMLRRMKDVGLNTFVVRFVTERYFKIEDEDGNLLDEFRFSNWSEGATMLLDSLKCLCWGNEVQRTTRKEDICGIRTNESV